MIAPDLETCHTVWPLSMLLFCGSFARVDDTNAIPGWLLTMARLFDVQVPKTKWWLNIVQEYNVKENACLFCYCVVKISLQHHLQLNTKVLKIKNISWANSTMNHLGFTKLDRVCVCVCACVCVCVCVCVVHTLGSWINLLVCSSTTLWDRE